MALVTMLLVGVGAMWRDIHSATGLKKFAEQFATDKMSMHAYEELYWREISRIVTRLKHAPRILEIGLGCYMPLGAGGSAEMWRALFPSAAIHVFEFQVKCGDEWEYSHPDTVVLHYGDQSNKADLLGAVEGELPFDLIIDDGSHMSAHQHISLTTLWSKLAPGGTYIVEDVHSSCQSWPVPGRSC